MQLVHHSEVTVLLYLGGLQNKKENVEVCPWQQSSQDQPAASPVSRGSRNLQKGSKVVRGHVFVPRGRAVIGVQVEGDRRGDRHRDGPSEQEILCLSISFIFSFCPTCPTWKPLQSV